MRFPKLRYNGGVAKYEFSELVGEIQLNLNTKLQLGNFAPDNHLTLIEGFFYMPVQKTVGGNYQIGGPAIPMVGAYGNITGQTYFFPLKVIVPRVELE